MRFRYLYIFLFVLASSSVICQANFQEDQLKDFVDVYMSFKIEKKRNHSVDKALFEQYNVSPNRYKIISMNALAADKIELNDNEKSLIEAIKKANKLEQERRDGILSQLCVEKGLSKSTYDDILLNYRQDIVFQRSLKPYFDTYIKGFK